MKLFSIVIIGRLLITSIDSAKPMCAAGGRGSGCFGEEREEVTGAHGTRRTPHAPRWGHGNQICRHRCHYTERAAPPVQRSPCRVRAPLGGASERYVLMATRATSSLFSRAFGSALRPAEAACPLPAHKPTCGASAGRTTLLVLQRQS